MHSLDITLVLFIGVLTFFVIAFTLQYGSVRMLRPFPLSKMEFITTTGLMTVSVVALYLGLNTVITPPGMTGSTRGIIISILLYALGTTIGNLYVYSSKPTTTHWLYASVLNSLIVFSTHFMWVGSHVTSLSVRDFMWILLVWCFTTLDTMLRLWLMRRFDWFADLRWTCLTALILTMSFVLAHFNGVSAANLVPMDTHSRALIYETWRPGTTVLNTLMSLAALALLIMLNRYVENLHQVKHETQFKNHQLESILATSPQVIILKDGKGRWLKANDAALQLFGYIGIDYEGKTDAELAIYSPHNEEALKLYCLKSDEAAWDAGEPITVTESVYNTNGELREFRVVKTPTFHSDGSRDGLVIVSEDVTEQRAMMVALDTSAAQYRALIESSPVAYIVHQDGKMQFANSKAVEILGGDTASDIIGVPAARFVAPSNHALVHDRMMRSHHEHLTTIEERFLRLDGREIDVEVSAFPIEFHGRPASQVVFVDISEKLQAAKTIEFMAYHDPLTSLPNRNLLLTQIREEIEKSGNCGVMLVDLDRFKHINDTLGHSVGDQVLQLVAKRLQRCIGEKGTVARLGGDEFAVVIRGRVGQTCLQRIGSDIVRSFENSFQIDDMDFYLTSSVGIALAPEHGFSPEVLLKRADMAMYAAKDQGKNNFAHYNADLESESAHRLEIENALRQAITNQEFEVYYQPIIELKTNQIVSLEALVRWHRPSGNVVSPLDFIPIAEETGLILPIGEIVVTTVVQQLKAWSNMGYRLVPVAINLSGRQFDQPDLIQRMLDIVHEADIDPCYIQFEITESTIMRDATYTVDLMHSFRKHGFKTAIDDFGTGYSSLKYLRDFPVDKIKIDRSFISGSHERNAAIIRATITLARELGLLVVAEGIESESDLEFLVEESCQLGQGYLFSKPIPGNECTKFFQCESTDLSSQHSAS